MVQPIAQSTRSAKIEKKIRLPRKVKTTLSNFQGRALQMFPNAISRIVLYGSYARGEATPESDVDVMVVIRKEKQPAKTYIGGPGDIRWKKLVNAAVDSMVDNGPFVSVMVVGEEMYQSDLSVTEAAREEGRILWTAQPT